jgi:hypothetical protein
VHARTAALTRPLAAQLAKAGATVQVLVPDGPELRRAESRYAPTLALLDDVSLGALSGTRKSELEQLGAFFFGGPTTSANKEVLTKPADIYLMVNASAIELPEFERFVNETAPKNATVVAFNLEAREDSRAAQRLRASAVTYTH